MTQPRVQRLLKSCLNSLVMEQWAPAGDARSTTCTRLAPLRAPGDVCWLQDRGEGWIYPSAESQPDAPAVSHVPGKGQGDRTDRDFCIPNCVASRGSDSKEEICRSPHYKQILGQQGLDLLALQYNNPFQESVNEVNEALGRQFCNFSEDSIICFIVSSHRTFS